MYRHSLIYCRLAPIDISEKYKVIKLLPNVKKELYEGHMNLMKYAKN